MNSVDKTLGTMAPTIAMGAALAAAAMLVLLHVLKPELDASWRFISEYAIGEHGWVMRVTFLAMALSCVALALAVRRHIRTFAGICGLVLLRVNAIGLLVAALFVTDPITTPVEAMSLEGKLHSFGGMLGLAMPLAIALISGVLLFNKSWEAHRWLLAGAALLAELGFAIALISMGVMLAASGGEFGPDVAVGWPNRFEVFGYLVWIVATSRILGIRHARSVPLNVRMDR